MTQLRRDREDRAGDEALLELAGAHIYSRESACRHMESELAKHPPGLITRRVGDAWSDTIKFFVSAATAVASIVAVQEAYTLLSGYMLTENDIVLLGIALLAPVGSFLGTFACLDRTWLRPASAWRTCQLYEDGTYYTGFMEQRAPSFVRSLMDSIRKVLPGCTFEIKVVGPDPIVTCITPRGSYVVLIYEGDRVIGEGEI